MNTVKEISSRVAKLEGKKHNASVGDVREIVGIVCDLLAQYPGSAKVLEDNGKRRARRRAR